ncbi:MAG: hypothetical protein AVDCRST_MAG76-2235 [uncultured Acidimicrobiales bacterium]|uniref:Uncharacterized protein n=1 Tax=uncultured Acidimicrobiales bacterium TaxID=310071 RepID=A0A6J4IFB3_9ACTN|nr:MAG: hypothetical protein AVDCRST_MAG76-2235 [uncultured Acidimicrobiales bacterium]
MPPRPRLTTAEEVNARVGSAASERPKTERSEEDRARRKERVEKAKDALTRSNGLKGDHVVAGRSALKLFLRNLNDPKQPNDEQFEAIVEAPFKAPPKPKSFGGQGGGRR